MPWNLVTYVDILQVVNWIFIALRCLLEVQVCICSYLSTNFLLIIKQLVDSLEQNICCYKTSFHPTTAGRHQVWGRNEIQHLIYVSFLPQTWWSPAVVRWHLVLYQQIFCSRESTNCLMIQQDEKSTQIYWLYFMAATCALASWWL